MFIQRWINHEHVSMNKIEYVCNKLLYGMIDIEWCDNISSCSGHEHF